MEIPKINFKTINASESISRGSEPTMTLYDNGIYLSKKVIDRIIGKYEYASVSVGGNIIVIQFSKIKKDNSFLVRFKSHKKTDGYFDSAMIGSTNLSKEVAKELDLSIDDNKYYRSVDFKQVDNVFYFQIDKNKFLTRKSR